MNSGAVVVSAALLACVEQIGNEQDSDGA